MNKYNSLLEKYYSQEKWLLDNDDKAQDEYLAAFTVTVNQLGILIKEIETKGYTVTDQEVMAVFNI
jgi:NOL1/NOP2/fmu family ribosome biogenesis protein